MTDRDLIRELAEALQYHRDQTRPIDRTDAALTAARERLAREDQPDDVWLRVVDEAMVCSHIGTAEKSDDYDAARLKLNNLLAHAQSIGEYFANQSREDQPAAETHLDVRIAAVAADRDYWREQALAAQPAAVSAQALQGGMTNDELRAALRAKLPTGAYPEEDWLTPFALGVEVGAALAAQPAPEPAEPKRDREADRQRFTDPAFNRWLDEGISDSGHTVWDAVGDVQAAWQGWTNREFYASPPRPAPVALLSEEDLERLWCEAPGLDGQGANAIAYGRAVEAECRRRMMGE